MCQNWLIFNVSIEVFMIKNIIIIALLISVSVGGYMAINTIDGLKGTITALTIKHKKQLLKTKVKERGKRLLAAIPVVGIVAIGWFEKQEYEEWKEDNPDGTFDDYSNEVINATSEAADEAIASYCKDIGDYCDNLKTGL